MNILVRSRIRKRKINGRAVRDFAEAALRRAGMRAPGELGILFVGKKAMRRLNGDFLGRKRDTDVLAFPIDKAWNCAGRAGLFGDIVISVDMAEKQAGRWGTSVNHEILLYIVHGILHLSGMDDSSPKQRREMDNKQREILRSASRRRKWNVIN
jgi:probable rRNA maturation factor